MMVLYVGLGGAVGAMLRYGMVRLSTMWFGVDFPYGTLMVNILGSIAMGMLVGIGAHHMQMSQEMRALLQVGVLGGFTTFSAFSLDIVSLFERGETLSVGGYIIASLLLSVIGLMLGMMVVRP